jgi:uncharacterized OB-fold protein
MSSSVTHYGGTEITSEEMKSGLYLLESYRTTLRYAWSAGVATGRFLEGLKEGIIWGRKCDQCGRILVPPRMYCEDCFRPTDSWVRLEDTGKVATYSISYVNADASRRKEPIIVAVIEIDGASPLAGMLHLIAGVDPDKVSVGMAVKAVWMPKNRRSGAITDIRHFKPI